MIFYFQIYLLFLHVLELFEHSKYMIIYEIEKFEILVLLQIVKFWKFAVINEWFFFEWLISKDKYKKEENCE